MQFYQNGFPDADYPISTADEKQLFFKTTYDSAYIDKCHGISFNRLLQPFHYVSQEYKKPHIFFNQNWQIFRFQLSWSLLQRYQITLSFSKLDKKLTQFLLTVLGEFPKTIFDPPNRRGWDHWFSSNCKNLKRKLNDVFAVNFFSENSFLINNAATSENAGTHWLLFSQKSN